MCARRTRVMFIMNFVYILYVIFGDVYACYSMYVLRTDVREMSM